MVPIKAITKIFGMFDKIDDIVYEPVKLVCDVLRQPLKQIDAHNEKAKAENDQRLEKELKQFEADLEHQKQERSMKLSIEEKRLEEEINQMILENDMARRKEMIDMEAKYRKEMATAAAELAQIIANIQVDTRGKILALYTEKEKEYLDLQAQYKHEMFETVKTLREIYPDGSGEDIIRTEITTQLKAISDRSTNFSTLMNDDLKSVFGIINNIVVETSAIASKYFMPIQNQPALTQKIVDDNQPALPEDSTVTTETK